MSSYKNAMKTNHVHRERRQPEERKHLGFLEKKKDYKRRADDFNAKKEALKVLRQKALDKNPDEFHHSMINSKIVDGKHTKKSSQKQLDNAELSPEQLMLMKTQDINYINSKLISEKRKLQRLQSSLHLISSETKPQNKHTFFVDSAKEKHEFDLATRLNTHPALIDRAYNRPKMEDLKSGKFSAYLDPAKAELLQKKTAKMYKDLEKRMDREQKLSVLQRKMQIRSILKPEKNKPEKTIKKETRDSAPVYKWPQERKK